MKARNTNRPIHKKPARAPLQSWDIFMEGYWRKQALLNDKTGLEEFVQQHHWQDVFDFEKFLLNEEKVIIVTDPSLQIVFASSNMPVMNGYSTTEVIGKTPKIFQGPGTSEDSRQAIRLAIESRDHFQVSLINYKKNGLPYQCNIDGYPVFNRRKELVHFIAFETTEEI